MIFFWAIISIPVMGSSSSKTLGLVASARAISIRCFWPSDNSENNFFLKSSIPTSFKHCFFFQAEDGIRDWSGTGVQTCALPIRSEEHTSELQSLTNLGCRIIRSGEHTSELQSLTNLVCRLLLEKKHTKTKP